MIRKLMASTALLALMSAGAMAQTTTTTTQQTDQTQAVQPVEGAVTEMQQGESLATRLMGQSVYSSDAQDAERIGEVDDLIVDETGNVTAAVIGVGGFLGIGEKKVAIEYNRLQVIEPADGRDMRVVLPATKEELLAAAEFQRQADQRIASEMNAGQPATAEVDQQVAATDANQQTAGTETSTVVVPQPAAGTEQVQQPAAAETTQTTTATTEPAATAETQQSTVVVTQPADAAQQTAQVEQPAAAGTEQPAVVTTDAATAVPPLNFVQINDPDQMRASNWLGKEVYIGENESIGEISDIVLSEAGRAESAIIDVGGFLGAGERRIAIPFADIQAAQAQDGGEARLTAALDRAAIEQLQPYGDNDDMAVATQPADGQTSTTVTVEGQQPAAGEQTTQTAETTTTTTETAQPAPGTQTAETSQGQTVVVQDGTTAPAATDGQTALAAQGLSADRLLGSRVYGANNEDLGEVGDVIFTNGGDIRAVVVDVGGFLGIGEKPVAIQYDGLNVQNDKDGELRLMVNATEDQLEQAPAYK